MRKGISGAWNILVLAAVAWGAWWAWQAISGGPKSTAPPGPVLDIDKQCRIAADTGQCICRHAQTGERLSLPYEECRERARNP